MSDVHVKTLQRAAEIVGGEEMLAWRLNVTPSHLALWLQGKEEPPTGIFLRAVDLVLDYEMTRLGKRDGPGRDDSNGQPNGGQPELQPDKKA